MNGEQLDELEAWLDHYIEHLAGNSDVAPTLGDLSPDLRGEARRRAFTVSELARELTRLGWSVSGAELGEIEPGKRLDVPGTAIPLLISYLNVSSDDFAGTGVVRVDQLLSLDRVRSQIEAAAQRLGRPFEEISTLLRPQLAGAHFREHDSQEDDVAEIVQTLLDAIE